MLISVIIPIYNAELYLKTCIDAVLGQSYTNFEVLLINDGSTDNSADICDEYLKRDNRIKVVHKQNEGSASARNVGLELAQGEYIVFIDADDYIESEYLQILVNKASEENADIVQCDYLSVKNIADIQCIEKKNVAYATEVFSNIDFLECFCDKRTYLPIAVLWNKIYRRELFDSLRFPVGRGIDDEYLICQIIYRANKILWIHEVLYYYILSENSQMRSKPSLKRIDGIDAIESQMCFFEEIGQPKLYNMIQYRYYATVIANYYFVERFFPEEKKILAELKKKKKKFYTVLRIKEVNAVDKVLLLIRNYLPRIFEVIHRKVNEE